MQTHTCLWTSMLTCSFESNRARSHTHTHTNTHTRISMSSEGKASARHQSERALLQQEVAEVRVAMASLTRAQEAHKNTHTHPYTSHFDSFDGALSLHHGSASDWKLFSLPLLCFSVRARRARGTSRIEHFSSKKSRRCVWLWPASPAHRRRRGSRRQRKQSPSRMYVPLCVCALA